MVPAPREYSTGGRTAVKIKVKVTICTDDWARCFGDGPYQLLTGVRELGSLRAAAQSMGMAYTKAFHLIKGVEAALGQPLTRRTIGGRGGGGSVLTPVGEDLLTRYEAYRSACCQEAHRLYDQYFSGFFPQGGSQPQGQGDAR